MSETPNDHFDDAKSPTAIPRGNAVAILRVQWLNRDLRSLEI